MLNAANSWISGDELFENLGLTNQFFNRKKYLNPLLNFGWIEMKYPDKKSNSNQRYKNSETGKRLLSLIN